MKTNTKAVLSNVSPAYLSKNDKFLMAAVMVAAVFVFLPSAGGDFVNVGDVGYVLANTHLSDSWPQFLRYSFTSFDLSTWHPLTWISYRIDYMLWGRSPEGYRLFSLLCHVINSALVVVLALRFASLAGLADGGARLLAVAVAGFGFALHPMHVEPVAWIASRSVLLSSMFWLLSVLAYLRYVSFGGGRHYMLGLFFFALSCLAAPMAAMLPAVLLLMDWYPLERDRSFGESLIEKLPYLALSVFVAVMVVLAQNTATPLEGAEPGLFARLLISVWAIGVYLFNSVLPFWLVPWRTYPVDVSIFDFQYYPGILVALAATVMALRLAVRWRVVLFGWGLMLMVLLPVLGITGALSQAAAPRFMYLPLLGVLAVAAGGAVVLWNKGPRWHKPVIAALTVWVVLLGIVTQQESLARVDSASLWSHAYEANPDDPQVRVFYGKVLYDLQKYSESESVFKPVFADDPSAGTELGASCYYARTLKALGRNAEALDPLNAWFEAIARVPDLDGRAAFAAPRKACHQIRGDVYLETGQPQMALLDYEDLIVLDGSDPQSYLRRGIARLILEGRGEAEEDFLHSLKLDPSLHQAHVMLLKLYMSARDYASAEEQLDALAALPEGLESYACERAELYIATGRQDEARHDIVSCEAQRPGALNPVSSFEF